MAVFFTNECKCATCQYWDGRREITSDVREVKCPDDTWGMCMGRISPVRGKKTPCYLRVPLGCYKTWYVLKD